VGQTTGANAAANGTSAAAIENNSGLQVGTFKADTAIYTTSNRSAVTVAPTSATTGLLNGNSLVINGIAIAAAVSSDDSSSFEGTGILGVTVAGGTSSTRAAGAIAIAAAINRSSEQTGVTAKAASNIIRGTGFTLSTAAATGAGVFLNGVTFRVPAANGFTVDQVIDRFNEFSSQTGVVASRFGTGMQLEAADGRNIVIGSSAAAAHLGLADVSVGSAGTGVGAAAHVASVQLSSANAIDIKAGSNGNANLEALGFFQGVYGASKNGVKIAQVDVSTAAGATQALVAIDSAINTVSAAQAKSGAINNRLDVIISNLAEGSKNMQASRSRILDTDYAMETTNLAKQQIIQQAATAMLAQANQSAQGILSLLK
jgi:flagellin